MTVCRDLIIIGAGPAGAAAAISARAAELSVAVIDKATFPRDKICGDGLTAGALRQLERFSVDPADIPSWNTIDDVLLSDTRGRPHRFPLPQQRGQYGAVARRAEVDQALVQRAIDVGADVQQGLAMERVDLDGDRVRVTTPEGQFVGRYLVAADGMWSPTRKALGLGPQRYRGEWHAFRQYATPTKQQPPDELWIWFDADLLPGYAWSFPLADGTVNVGFGLLRTGATSGATLAELWRGLSERPGLRDVIGPDPQWEGPGRAWPIPARLGRLPLTAGRVLFAGDATGATDPMTGEGIGQALETGSLAVDCIVEAGPDRPQRAADRYQLDLQRTMQRDHGLARTLSGVLRSPAATDRAIKLADLTPWTRRNFARWLFEDYPRAVLGTPSRISRSTFGQPGSYLRTKPPRTDRDGSALMVGQTNSARVRRDGSQHNKGSIR